MSELPLDQVLQGDCIEVLSSLPAESVDLIFADPPYNLQLQKELLRPNQTRVDRVDDKWDQFEGYAAYDAFTRAWLTACRRVLKPNGTLWAIGTYHNIHRVGAVLQDLDFWTLNEITWIKANPMPNFRGMRFANAHETLLWVQKKRGVKYRFNHHTMKALNGGKQMRSDWLLPICTGKERLKVNGEKAHSTQKPESLLFRVITSSSDPGHVVLDPFFGSGTTGAVAKRLHRRWLGIEQRPEYVELARKRIEAVVPDEYDQEIYMTHEPRRLPRLAFGRLVEMGHLPPGTELYYQKAQDKKATVRADGTLQLGAEQGTIHSLAKQLMDGPANGWLCWYYMDPTSGELEKIDLLREQVRNELYQIEE
ncbi:MAG: site-specific DNA-methyltransferase [Chloroflexota bacterium]